MTLENEIRLELLDIARNKPLHLGGCFSCIDILTTLYFKVMNVDPKNPLDPNRDRFILSKGHAAYALYAVLKRKGYPIGDYSTWCHHPEINRTIGIEATTGSLGHGLSIGCGMALAAKRNGLSYKVYVLLGDGECQEGSVWEAAQFAKHHKLDNLVAIVDCNDFQALGKCFSILSIPGFGKWDSFGWFTDISYVKDIKKVISKTKDYPQCVLVATTKGSGVSFMMNEPLWHFRGVTESEYIKAKEELCA